MNEWKNKRSYVADEETADGLRAEWFDSATKRDEYVRFKQSEHSDMEQGWALYVLSTAGVIALLVSGAWFLYTVADWLAS